MGGFRANPIPGLPRVIGEIPTRRSRISHPPAVHARRTGAQNVAYNTWVTVELNASDLFDTDSMHDPGSNNTRVYAMTPGIYHINGWISWVLESSGLRSIRIMRNGVSLVRQVSEQATLAIVGNDMEVNVHYNLAAGEYVELEGYQTRSGGGSLNMNTMALSMVFVAPTPLT
ncbi:hypothetical protein LCGC14_0830700 [marine sediment metagenome]|uniref:C1q domain-containing protein n=1 Tax=marine sediment metagenome TaxID=412755 RepID=A0A0F9PG32_9ZZZZ